MLDFNQLKCFVAVAEELHFGRAAERLFMTQSPLSRQIQLLEHAMGVKLFERTSRTVSLTMAGRVFLTDATRLLNLAEQATISAKRVSKGETGRVTIGFTAVAGYELLPKLVNAAQRELPDIDLVLKEMVSVEQQEALVAHVIDLGLMRPLATRQSFECRTVTREQLMVALPADHPLAARNVIELDDMDGLPLIMYSPSGGKYFHDLIISLFCSSGVRPVYIQHIEQTHTIVSLVRSGLGVAIVPASAAQFRFENVVFKPMWRNDVFAEISLAWRPDQDNPALTTFRRFAMDYFSRQMESVGSAAR